MSNSESFPAACAAARAYVARHGDRCDRVMCEATIASWPSTPAVAMTPATEVVAALLRGEVALPSVEASTEWTFWAHDTDRSWGWSNHVFTLGQMFAGYGSSARAALEEARAARREDYAQATEPDEEDGSVYAIRAGDLTGVSFDDPLVPAPTPAPDPGVIVEVKVLDDHGACVEEHVAETLRRGQLGDRLLAVLADVEQHRGAQAILDLTIYAPPATPDLALAA